MAPPAQNGGMRSKVRARRVVQGIVVGLVVVAVVQEMSKPRELRTWRGRVAGVVPYDFNLPTWERLRQSIWNPDDPRLFTDRAFGIGWDVNLHRACVLLSGLVNRLTGDAVQPIRLHSSDRG